MRIRRLLTLGHSYVVGQNRRLAEELTRAGRGRWEVTAAAPRFFHGDLRDIELEPLPDSTHRLVPLTAIGSRSAHLFFYEPAVARLMREGFDLIHGWEEPFVVAGAQLAALAPRSVPLVLTSAQNLDKRYPPPFGALERFSVSRARALVVLGRTVGSTLERRRGYSAKRLEFIPLGVDTERFRPDPEARRRIRAGVGFAQTHKVVGYLGRFVAEKGLGVLGEALGQLPGEWRALFVGGGPLQPQLEELGRRFPGRVRIVTQVPHDEVPAYLAAMDVLCAPSQTTPRWIEQFGRMIVEANACGVPVIGSDSGEVPFTVGDTGRVVGERDVAGWAKAIGELLGDDAGRTALGARARARAELEFSWRRVAERHLELFEELCR